jgi:hypothetical protein
MDPKSTQMPEDPMGAEASGRIAALFSCLANAKPRDGFVLRVIARLDEPVPERIFGWRSLGLPVLGALVSILLLFAAFRLPEPAWMDSDRSLTAMEKSQWSDTGTIQLASYDLEEVHE